MSSRTDQAIGKMKQTMGELAHHGRVRRRGRAEEVRGRARHFFGHVRKSLKRLH